ncbi:MAG: hypothetical protein OXU31_08445 [Gammaproteobacteria bacterium]|nr:hypothetical protein [Gammaproteobacteria bacterium]MDD9851460.1 hypothetical protein [Gammaproteobacteria bacterium]
MKLHQLAAAVVATFVILTAVGCAPTAKAPELTPLEIQSLQTREYEHPKEVVFPSVISVFQDLGYTIKSVETEAGIVTAQSTTQNTTSGLAVFAAALGGGRADQKNAKTLATASVEEIGGITKVRLNFVVENKSSSAWGQSSEESEAILDAQVYQNAFERIESAIFVRSSN